MNKTKANNPDRKRLTEKIVAPNSARSEALEIRLLNACSKIHALEKERESLNGLLAEESSKVYEMEEAERIRVEKKKAAWILALKLALLGLFAFGCTISAIASFLYAPWWTAIAPVVLLIMGCYKSLMG